MPKKIILPLLALLIVGGICALIYYFDEDLRWLTIIGTLVTLISTLCGGIIWYKKKAAQTKTTEQVKQTNEKKTENEGSVEIEGDNSGVVVGNNSGVAVQSNQAGAKEAISAETVTINKPETHYHYPDNKTPQATKGVILYDDYLIAQEKIIGREDALQEIGKKLAGNNLLVLVNGVGGIGKTAVAVDYFYKHREEYDNLLSLQITDGLFNALSSKPVLLDKLGIAKEYRDSPENLISAFSNTLTGYVGNNLLLLDDIGTDYNDFSQYLPRRESNWKVLLTSRARLEGCEVYPLDLLTLDAAVDLFNKHYQGNTNKDKVETLVNKVGRHSLGVKLLAKSAHALALNLDELLKKGIDLKIEIDFEKESAQGIIDYLGKTFPLDKLETGALSLLRKLAFLPDDFIELEQIKALLEEYDLKFISGLEKRGLIDRSQQAGNDSVRMHRIVKEWVEAHAKPNNMFYAEHQPFLDSLLEQFEYDAQNPEHLFGDKIRWLAFAGTASNILKKEASKKAISFVDCCAFLYETTGDYWRAKTLFQACLDNAIKTAEKTLIARQQSHLGNVLRDLGDYAGAKKHLEKALQSNLEHFGEKYSTVAILRSNLANVLGDLGDYAGAKKHLEKALQSDLENFDENHSTVATCRSNLGEVLRNLGDHAGAKKHLEKALQSNLENFGEKHSTVASSRSNLGLVLEDLGDHARAKEHLEKALRSDLENFGEKHPTVAIRRSNLGAVLKDLGDYAGAREHREKALQSDLKHFGEKHPTVATRHNNLAHVYLKQNDLSNAEKHFKKALEILENTLPPEHPHIAITKESLAELKKIIPS